MTWIGRAKTVQSVLDNIAAEVRTLPKTALPALASTLHKAQVELEKDMRRYLSTVDGNQKFTMQQYRNAITQVRGALEEIEHLAPGMKQTLDYGSDQAGAMAVRHVEMELVQFSHKFDLTINPVPLLQANKIITAEGRHSKMQQHETSARRYAGQVGVDLRQQLAIGMIRGETVHQMTKRLMGVGKIKNLPDASKQIASHLFNKYTYWAERIVRTETINSYNIVANESIKEAHEIDPRIQRMWSSAEDRRTCGWCASMDHEITELNEPFTGGVMSPPLHPNCRCAVIAWRTDWSDK